MGKAQVVQRRGWDIVQLRSDELQVEVVPGKGGDVLSVVWLPADVELLWQSPWGLRDRGAPATSGDSVARIIEAYPGGWQTVFPNGGDAVTEHGTEWGMHGEVWLTPFDWAIDGDAAIEMRARLVRSPFAITKRVALEGARLTVSETVTNEGFHPVEAMWSQHPAFAAPLLSADARIETAAGTFVVDDERDTATSDLELGARSPWPRAPGRNGDPIDLRRLPGPDGHIDRLGYLTDFERGFVSISNPALGVAADLTWDASVLPHAWYWLEAHGTAGFPWFGAVYVLAIEPATSYPGQGLHAVRAKSGTQVKIEPGETRTVSVTLTVRTIPDDE